MKSAFDTRPIAASVSDQQCGCPATTVEKLDPQEDPGWDTLLLSHPDYSFFHSRAWASVLRDSYGYTPIHFAVRGQDRLLGLVPVMEVDSWLTGRRGVSLPFSDFCQPLSSAAVSSQDLLREALAYGQSRRWKYLEWRGETDSIDPASAAESYYGHVLPLCESEDDLFARLDSGVRRAIRKAEHSGVRVEIAHSREAVETFYGLHCLTRKRHGVPPQPFRFFARLHEHVLNRDLGFIALASYQERPVAAAVFLHLGKKAIYKYGASDTVFNPLRGNNAAMWQAIKHCARQGHDVIHFGRTSRSQGGLRRFKQGWGAEEHEIRYWKYDLGRGAFVAGTEGEVSRYARLFRILPGWLSRAFGWLLYKHAA